MIDGKHKAWHHSGSISSPLPSWDSSPDHLRIACVAKFHHCSRTLVCHRSSTLKVKMYVQKTCHMSHMRGSATHHPRGCRSALGSTPQCILCHTGSSESHTSCCLLAVVTLKRFMVNSSPSNS